MDRCSRWNSLVSILSLSLNSVPALSITAAATVRPLPYNDLTGTDRRAEEPNSDDCRHQITSVRRWKERVMMRAEKKKQNFFFFFVFLHSLLIVADLYCFSPHTFFPLPNSKVVSCSKHKCMIVLCNLDLHLHSMEEKNEKTSQQKLIIRSEWMEFPLSIALPGKLWAKKKKL